MIAGVEQAVIEIVTRVTGASPRDVRPASRLAEDLGVDSLAGEEILDAVERQLGVSIPLEASTEIETVADIVAAVRNLRGGA